MKQDAYALSDKLSQFYFDSVGKPFDYLAELSILLDWDEAIEFSIKEAKRCHFSWLLHDMLPMRAECKMWLEHNSESQK